MSTFLVACVDAGPMQPATTEADIASRTISAPGDDTAMTREELEVQVRRFMQRYIAQLSQFIEDRRTALVDDPARRNVAVIYELETIIAGVEIAIGDNAVTNLLDAIVLATLTRKTIENYWVDQIDDPAMAQRFLAESKQLEAEIWSLSASVMTPAEQASLSELIDQWYAEHQQQIMVQRIRFGSFSGQRAAELGELQQTGGMIGRVDRALDEVAESRRLGERALFYMQFLPVVYSLQTEQIVYDFYAQPETARFLDDFNRISYALETASGLAASDPRGDYLAIRQILDGIAEERSRLIEQVMSEQETMSRLFTDAGPALSSLAAMSENINAAAQALERTASMTGYRSGNEPTDYEALTTLAQTSMQAVIQMRELVESMEHLIESQALAQQAPSAFEAIDKELDDAINRFFALAGGLVLFFFIVLYAYRRLVRNL